MAKDKNIPPNESKHARYERLQKERGFVKVHPWCPKDDADAVKNYAAKKCKVFLKKKSKV